ncbi:MAG: DM13 domain-containing protein [Phototrophicaceae bacterium]|jgi:hypothetical protein
MNSQFRATLILLGALLVALTYTFPIWQPYLNRLPGGQTVFPGLPAELTDAYLLLPEDQRTALNEVAEEDPNLALQLVLGQLRQDNVVPPELQATPQMVGPTLAGLGDFIAPDDRVQAEGQITLFVLADGRYILRLDNFRVTNLPQMTVYLSASVAPLDQETFQRSGAFQAIGELQGNVGGQNYPIAPQTDLSEYNTVVIYSESLNVVVAYARFAVRF